MSHYQRSTLHAVLAASVIGGLTACAGSDPLQGKLQAGQIVGGSTVQMTEVHPVGGFLPQPSLLQPGGDGRAALYYVNPDVRPSSYSKILLEPVVIWAPPDSRLNTVPADQRLAAANTFHSNLFNAMNQHCTMVNRPSPGTLRMRFALVDAKLPNSAVNTVATYAPYVGGAYSLASFAFNDGVGYFAGTATAEGYATDAQTGKLVWEAVDKRGGTTAMVENTLNTWLDVDHAFKAWSQQLVRRLQDVGVCRG
jgi:hypothetical protein